MSAYSEIEQVSARPRNLNSGPPGWGFVMWSQKLDDEAPHRQLLEQFAELYPNAGVELPAYDRYEDYVEATAAWDSGEIAIYYETILSYLWLWSPNRDVVTSFREVILSLVR